MRPALTRRGLLMAAPLLALPAWAAPPPGGRLLFAVYRGGEKVGDHEMSFARRDGLLVVTTQVAMKFRIGPIGVDYAHQAKESWRGDAFEALETSTTTSGKRERVTARRGAGAVTIETGAGAKTAAVDAAPLTHWNLDALRRPLFNPQNGKVLKTTVSRSAAPLPGPDLAPGPRWSVRGSGADIDDWYDAAGVWTALRGRLPDRSLMEYRRV